jgi:DNA-binding transcriptional MerR regulator
MLTEVGLTYRKLDYWSRRGYLVSERAKPGSGHPRTWSSDEIAVARAICRLTGVGFTLSAAAKIAREHYTSGHLHIRLAPGIALGFTPDLWAPAEDTAPEGQD